MSTFRPVHQVGNQVGSRMGDGTNLYSSQKRGLSVHKANGGMTLDHRGSSSSQHDRWVDGHDTPPHLKNRNALQDPKGQREGNGAIGPSQSSTPGTPVKGIEAEGQRNRTQSDNQRKTRLNPQAAEYGQNYSRSDSKQLSDSPVKPDHQAQPHQRINPIPSADRQPALLQELPHIRPSQSQVPFGKPHKTLTFDAAQPTYFALINESILHHIVFRVHDRTSASKLIWTGNEETSGFRCIHPSLCMMGREEYERMKRGLGNVDWGNWRHVRKSMIDHILLRGRDGDVSRPSQQRSIHKRDTAQKSCWISTTRQLDWAIFEVARRLALGQPIVRVAIIRQGSSLQQLKNRPTQWTRSDQDQKRRLNNEEIFFAPIYHLQRYAGDYVKPQEEKEDFEKAGTLCETSKETLFYGRVFGKSIEGDLLFTPTELPFCLPSKYWKPQSEVSYSLKGWLPHLRWDPVRDDFETAIRKMSRHPDTPVEWNQPLHGRSAFWPPPDVIKGRGRHNNGSGNLITQLERQPKIPIARLVDM